MTLTIVLRRTHVDWSTEAAFD